MISQPAHANSKNDSSTELERESPTTSQKATPPACQKAATTQKAAPAPKETQEEHVELPEPDAENITVLTNKLPNKPILPWNRYDSPWEEPETESETEAEKAEDPENPSDEAAVAETQSEVNEDEDEPALEETEPDEVE